MGKKLKKIVILPLIICMLLNVVVLPIKAVESATGLLTSDLLKRFTVAKTVNGFNEKSKLCDGLITEGSRMSSGVDSAGEYYFVSHFNNGNDATTQKVKTVVIDWYAKNFDYYLVKQHTGKWESNDDACRVYTDLSQSSNQEQFTIKRGAYHDTIIFNEPVDVRKLSIMVPQSAFHSSATNVFGETITNMNYISMTEYQIYGEGEIPELTPQQVAYEIDLQNMTVETTENKVTLPSAYDEILEGYDITYHCSDNTVIDEQGNIFTPENNRYLTLSLTLTKNSSSVNTREFSIYVKGTSGEDSLEFRQNLARKKGVTAVASSEEVVGANKTLSSSLAIDGVIDNDHRWASQNNAGTDPLPEEWLQIDLGEIQKVEQIVLHWQRPNIINYRVEVSSDGQVYSTVYEGTEKLTADTLKTVINLESEMQQLRYVRISSGEYDDTKPDGSKGGYTAVSLLEVQLFDNKNESYPEISDVETARAFVEDNSTKGGVIGLDQDRLNYIDLEKYGYDVEVCADYEQVLGKDGEVYRPLTDTTVKYIYKVSDGFEKSESAEYVLNIAGQHQDAGINAKPNVIPELAQWYGATGEFQMTEQSRIIYNEDELERVALAMQQDLCELKGIELEVVKGESPKAGDFVFGLAGEDSGLGKEGYEMNIADSVKVNAVAETGAYYATRSILQILVQTDDNVIAKGLVRDYPKYQIRGFMMDVARKPIQLETVEQISKAMAWYKLNDFQIHLNDNYAKMEKHLENPNQIEFTQEELEALMDEVYSAFRLESNEEGLTSTDLFYTKEEFKNLYDEANAMGINIVPEIDVPSHSLAFIKNHRDFYYKGTIHGKPSADRIAMLDVTDERVVEYIKGVFAEFIDDGTFKGNVVNIGSDEFYGSNEDYRKFVDEMLRYIKIDKGRTPRVWGSLTNKRGSTEVYSDGVQMNIWNTSWANPTKMLEEGYNLINMNDVELYIVAGGNYYHDYLDNEYIYNTFEPNRFKNVATIPAGNEQMLGASFALWNDGIDLSSNGVNEFEINQRILKALPAVSAKMWGDGGDSKDLTYDEFEQLSQVIGEDIPGANLLSEIDSVTDKVVDYDFDHGSLKDESGNGYDIVSEENVTLADDVLELKGGKSFVSTNLTDLGPVNHLSVSVYRDEDSDDSEQILLESDQGTIKAVQKETLQKDGTTVKGKVGYSREGYDYSFDYELPKGQWVDLEIVCDQQSVRLFVDGELTDTKPIKQMLPNHKTDTNIHDTSKYRLEDYPTLVLPLAKIGSEEHAFIGKINNFKVYNKAVSDIDYQNLLKYIESLDEEDYSSNSWDNLLKVLEENQIIVSDTTTQKEINIAVENIENAIAALESGEPEKISTAVLEYAISLAETANTDGVITTVAENFEQALATAEEVLDLVQAGDTSVTQADVDAAWQNLIKAMQFLEFKQGDKTDLEKVIVLAETMEKDLDSYLDAGKAAFQKALDEAREVYADGDAMQDEVDSSWKALMDAMANMQLKPDKGRLEELILKASMFNETDYEAESYAAMRTALADAQAVFADSQATAEEVQAAETALEGAIAKLTPASKAAEESKDIVVNAGSTDNNGTTDSGNTSSGNAANTGSTAKSAKTGDAANAALPAAAGILAAAAAVFIWRKRK